MRLKFIISNIMLAAILLTTSINAKAANPYSVSKSNFSHSTLLNQDQSINQTIIHVPGDVPLLQTAINQVPDGGVIEIAAGTYNAPSGGFMINEQYKSFTMRAANGAQVVLDGRNSSVILQFMNTTDPQDHNVVFQDIVFANGKSNTAGLAGGVTIYKARATFINCTFQGNSATSNGKGGGVLVAINSIAFFFNCTWNGNSAVNLGGGLAIDASKVYIDNSVFTNNRTNLPGHSTTAAGGGIHVTNSVIRISNTRFEGNQAGYVGGGLYVLGSWATPVTTPSSDVLISNSTFINNRAAKDPSISFTYPTEGGGVHFEAQTTANIYNSRFVGNSADTGGGLSLYRAIVNVQNSVFDGNLAVGIGPQTGFGGAINVNSNDTSSDGSNNRRTSTLSVRDSLIRGGGVVAQSSGGIASSGDYNRLYGANGVSKKGTLAENQANVTIDRVSFVDLDVQQNTLGGSGNGGALVADITNLSVSNSLITLSDAIGATYSSGGGISILDQSIATIDNTTFAKNSTDWFGGALFVQGATINMTNSNLIENSGGTHYGVAIFTSPDTGRNIPVTGVIQGCTFSNSNDQPIFDDDRTNGPINDVRYNNNRFYHGSTNAIVYSDAIYPYSWKTVNELNSLVVSRANGTSTPKSQVPNTALSSPPVVGAIVAAPNNILMTAPNGDPSPPQSVYVGYAWSGASATMDGSNVSGFGGVLQTTAAGAHTLRVGTTPFSAQVSTAATPAATFDASLDATGTTLTWSVTAGTFLDAAIDQGVVITPTPSGSIHLSTTVEKVYHLYVLTQEGGIVLTANSNAPVLSAPDNTSVMVGLNAPNFYGSLQIMNLGGGTMNWTAISSNPNVVQVLTPNGQTEIQGALNFAVTINPQSYPGTQGPLIQTEVVYIDIDAGEAGTQRVTLNIDVLDHIEQIFLPLSIR